MSSTFNYVSSFGAYRIAVSGNDACKCLVEVYLLSKHRPTFPMNKMPTTKSEKTGPEFSTSAEVPSMTSKKSPLDSLASKITPIRASFDGSSGMGRDRIGSPPPNNLARLASDRPPPLNIATLSNPGEHEKIRFSSPGPGPTNLQVGAPGYLNPGVEPGKVSFSFPPVAMMNKVWGTGAGGGLPPRPPQQYNRPPGTERQSFQQTQQRETMHSPVQVLRINTPQNIELGFASPDTSSRRAGVMSPQPVMRYRDSCAAEVGMTRMLSPQPAPRTVAAGITETREPLREIQSPLLKKDTLKAPAIMNPLTTSLKSRSVQSGQAYPQMNLQKNISAPNHPRSNSDNILCEDDIQFVATTNDSSTTIGN